MDIGVVLENAILGKDPQTRSQAEAQLAEAARDHFVPYLGMLTQALGSAEQRTEVRILASIALKNQILAKDPRTKVFQAERWVALPADGKTQIKDVSLQALVSEDDRVANAAAQLVAAIAEIELPLREWPNLIPTLMSNTSTEKPTRVKRASLLAIGYICESSDPASPGVAAQSDGILTAIIQGAHSQEREAIVRITALNALVNSLEFVRRNFEIESERNVIMQVVCEATQADNTELQASAFGALGRIMSLYYMHMQRYMEQALFGLTVAGMQSEDDMVASMAVEFWSTVCEEEIDIAVEAEDLVQSGESLENSRQSYGFAVGALERVLPTLLTLLTRQDEDSADDDWSVAMAAGACLQLYAQDTGDAVVQKTLEFVSANLSAENWQQREAAVMAFGSILDGPNTGQLQGLIGQALRPILSLMQDSSLEVKDTVAWCIGRMADLVIDGINQETDLPLVIEAIIHGLGDHPKVSVNCCWTIMNLGEQLGQGGPESETVVLSRYYQPLIRALLDAASRSDNEYNSRTSAYEALSTLVIFSAGDVLPLIEGLSGEVLSRLESTIGMQQQIVGTEDKINIEELQVNLLGLLTNIIRRVGGRVEGAASQLMTLFIRLLETKLPNSLVEEDVFIAIGAVAGAVEHNFQVFMPTFLPFLGRALSDPEYQIVTTAVGLVADISHALGANSAPYAQNFIEAFLTILQQESAPREAKPVILSCIGDVASSIGTNFGPYLEPVMKVLAEAATLRSDPESSFEFMEYVDRLRESLLDAYVGIVAGMRDAPDVLVPYVPSIFVFLDDVQREAALIKEESVLRSVVGLIGDIASMYPQGQVQEYYKKEWLANVIRVARDQTIYSNATVETAKWARIQQRRQLQLATS